MKHTIRETTIKITETETKTIIAKPEKPLARRVSKRLQKVMIDK